MFTKIKSTLARRKNVAQTVEAPAEPTVVTLQPVVIDFASFLKGALDEPTSPVAPLDEATVSVGSGVGNAVVKRPTYGSGERVELRYFSNFGRGYDAGPITLTVEEWDNLAEAVESVLAEKPAVEVNFL
jgi:hypothetical protein